MPRMFKTKSLASQRKRNIANALGLRVKPTGKLRRAAQIQIMKRKAVIAKGLPASATGRFKVKDFQTAQAARERQIGTREVEVERQAKGSFGERMYNWSGYTPTPLMEKVKVPQQYEISPARSAIPASISLKRIPTKAHKGPRVKGRGVQKTFGGIKELGKRGTFKSRKSMRRL